MSSRPRQNARTSRRPKRIRSGASRLSLAPVGMIPLAILVAGGLALLRSNAAPEKPKEPVAATADTVAVPVPTRIVARGERLSGVEFTEVSWPRSRLIENYMQRIDPQNVALVSLPPMLPVPLSAVSASSGQTNAVVEGIPDGMRAITVRVDAESAVEGWARSGNNVDVILVQRASDGSDSLQSTVIAANVKILSAGSSTSPVGKSAETSRSPDTVTLLVTQEDALKIKTASLLGKLTFALRSATDTAPPLATAVDGRNIVRTTATLTSPRLIRGHAIGPDGRTYVLDEQSRWQRSPADLPVPPLSRD